MVSIQERVMVARVQYNKFSNSGLDILHFPVVWIFRSKKNKQQINKQTNKTENVENNDVYIIYRIDTFSFSFICLFVAMFLIARSIQIAKNKQTNKKNLKMYRLIDNISNKNKHTNKTENVENNDVYIIYRIDTYSWALQHIARRENAPDSASIVYVTFYFWLLLMLRRVNWYCNGKGGYFDSFKDRTQKAKKERFGWPLRGRIRSILLWYIRRLIFHAVFDE